MRLTLVHTNDLHGHVEEWTGWADDLTGRKVGGLARIASIVKTIRREAPDALVLDAGDTIADTMAAGETFGAVVVEAMNAIGYHAMALGNHEVDFGVPMLKRRSAEAQFPFLAANIEGPPGLARRWLVVQVAGLSVGLLGLGYTNTPLTTSPRNIAEIKFTDAFTAAAAAIPDMRDAGAQMIIALTHLGLSADRYLAQNVPGIDVIIGGHSHNRMRREMVVGSTVIVQAGAHGSDVGVLDLEVVKGRIRDVKRRLIPATTAPDEHIRAIVESRLRPLRERMGAVIGRASGPIERAQTLAGDEPRRRDAESPADSLFADLLRRAARTDIVLLPGVGYGVALESGDVTVADLRNLVPHDSEVSILRLTGAELMAVLEQAVENVFTDDPHLKVGGMIQVSGVEFTFTANRPFGERVRTATVGGRQVDTHAEYTVAVNALLASGGHRQSILKKDPVRSIGKEFDLLAAEWRRDSVLSPPEAGRIRPWEEVGKDSRISM